MAASPQDNDSIPTDADRLLGAAARMRRFAENAVLLPPSSAESLASSGLELSTEHTQVDQSAASSTTTATAEQEVQRRLLLWAVANLPPAALEAFSTWLYKTGFATTRAQLDFNIRRDPESGRKLWNGILALVPEDLPTNLVPAVEDLERLLNDAADRPPPRDPAMVALEAAFVQWRDQVEAAAAAAGVMPPALLPEDLSQRVSLLGRLHDYWRHALDHHARLVADEESKARVVGVKIPVPMRQEWLAETRYLERQLNPIAAHYGESRAVANARLTSQRWRPQDATSDVNAIMREVTDLPYQVVAAVLSETAPEKQTSQISGSGNAGVPPLFTSAPSSSQSLTEKASAWRADITEWVTSYRAKFHAYPTVRGLATFRSVEYEKLRSRIRRCPEIVDPALGWTDGDRMARQARARLRVRRRARPT